MQKEVVVREFKIISMSSFIHIRADLSKSSNVQYSTAGFFLKVGLDLLLLPYFSPLRHIIFLSSSINPNEMIIRLQKYRKLNSGESYSWFFPKPNLQFSFCITSVCVFASLFTYIFRAFLWWGFYLFACFCSMIGSY